MDERFQVSESEYGFMPEPSPDGGVANRVTGVMPRMSYTENNEMLVIECYLSGLSLNDLDVSVDNATLSISSKGRYGTDSFYRSVEIPEHVNADDIKTQFKSGCVKFIIPKQVMNRADLVV